MNLTYLAVTGGIVLATMVVYALLALLHGSRDDATAQVETRSKTGSRRGERPGNTPARTTDSTAASVHHDPS